MSSLPSLRQWALVVSRLGHPLLTTLVFVAVVAGRWLTGPAAVGAVGSVALVVGGISLWNLRQIRRGTYGNFDVSERRHRNSFYPVLLGLLGLAAVGLFRQPQAGGFRYGLGAAWGLLLVCYLLNFWLKVSLHAALSFFLAAAVWYLFPGWGWLALGVAGLIAASRLVLQRHSLPELLVGAALGLAAGGGVVWGLPHLAGR